MITIQRTTRDAWWLFLPVIIFFVGIMTYVSLAAHGFVPVFGTIYADASWLAPPISVLHWFILARYVYRLFFPVLSQVGSNQCGHWLQPTNPPEPLWLSTVETLGTGSIRHVIAHANPKSTSPHPNPCP